MWLTRDIPLCRDGCYNAEVNLEPRCLDPDTCLINPLCDPAHGKFSGCTRHWVSDRFALVHDMKMS